MEAKSIDQEFWTKYLDEYRLKKPMIGRGIMKNLPGDNVVMKGIRKAITAGLLKGEVEVSCFSESREIQGTSAAKLFIPETDDMETYVANLTEALGGKNFAISINRFALYCPEIWEQIQDIDTFIKKRLGYPAGQFETTVFFGNYTKTAFGLHRGPNVDVISFCLKGPKRIITWPYPYFAESSASIRTLPNGTVVCMEEPEAHMDACNIMDYNRGDVAYWPQSHWHMGCQPEDNQLTLTVSLVYDQKCAYSALFSGLLQQAMASQGLPDRFHEYWDSNKSEIPQSFAERSAWLKELVTSGEWDKLVENTWEGIRTSY